MSLIGETKLSILIKIGEDSTHGYALAKELGISHGYVYTHLSDLQNEGMIEVDMEENGRKFYTLTENGKLLLEALGE